MVVPGSPGISSFVAHIGGNVQVGHAGVTVIVSGFTNGNINTIVVSHTPFTHFITHVLSVSLCWALGVKVIHPFASAIPSVPCPGVLPCPPKPHELYVGVPVAGRSSPVGQ